MPNILQILSTHRALHFHPCLAQKALVSVAMFRIQDRACTRIYIQIFHLSNEKVSTNADVAHDRVNCLDTRSSSRESGLRLSDVQFRITDTGILAAVERPCTLSILHPGLILNFTR